MRFSKLTIDAISFWVGAAAASAFWFLLRWARPLFKQVRENWQKGREEAALRDSSNIEDTHRQNILKKAQGMHLAAPLFSLEEILIEPKLVAPPPQLEPGSEFVAQDQTSLTVPYLLQDSTFSSFYGTETLTIPEALSEGAHLAILGDPGMGKSVALAYIASLMAKKNQEMGALQEAIPFLLHVADLSLSNNAAPKDILDPISEFFTEEASLFHGARLPKFIRLSFSSGRALLLLDGLDEIPQEETEKVIGYLTALLKEYPTIRIITTASLEFLGSLSALGFASLSLKGWNDFERQIFLKKWGTLWQNYVALEAWVQAGPEQVEADLLNAWLSIETEKFTPLELTLKTWGSYAGDIRGKTAIAAIETHLRRLAPADIPVAALEALAMQVSLTSQPLFNQKNANAWVKSFEAPEEILEKGEEEIAEEKESKEKVAPKRGLVEKLAQSGLLTQHRDNQMRFMHPVFSGFLSGRALSNYSVDERLTNQSPWSGKTLSMHYMASSGPSSNTSRLVDTFLGTPDPILERNLLLMGGWLRDASRKASWRGKVLTALAKILQDDTQPLGLRGQIITALAQSNDPSVAALFRQLLQSGSVYIIQLAALGSGLMRDKKAVKPLSETLVKFRNTFTLSAATLALAAIGTDEALNALATALMQGEENLRRAAAEAFANHPSEGWETLKEALGIEDILVRRSALFGLARTQQAWADELILHTQLEDKEWAVRDIAAGILEKRKAPNLRIPRKLPSPSENPWLIAFAGQEGMGISPGAPATEVLMLALKSEDVDQKLAALAYLRRTPSEGVINALYHKMYGDNIEMREAVFLALVEIAASGVKLPSPQSFGLS
ncbi:MAG: NACHT domain-containing protein [Chloroflexi bacterium]|nr:NACHT domain-containing protein [Chloroflexota bacterium]